MVDFLCLLLQSNYIGIWAIKNKKWRLLNLFGSPFISKYSTKMSPATLGCFKFIQIILFFRGTHYTKILDEKNKITTSKIFFQYLILRKVSQFWIQFNHFDRNIKCIISFYCKYWNAFEIQEFFFFFAFIILRVEKTNLKHSNKKKYFSIIKIDSIQNKNRRTQTKSKMQMKKN